MAPVSYTHLDVYKRQDKDIVAKVVGNSEMLPPDVAPGSLVTTTYSQVEDEIGDLATVSYTHLDVYKRQILHFVAIWFSCRRRVCWRVRAAVQ